MSDAILVLNAGSSSLKFSVFQLEPTRCRELFRGQIEGIGAAARFVLHDGNGEPIEERDLASHLSLDHVHWLGLVLETCESRLGNNRVVAVGHRVVHGGVAFSTPVRIDAQVIAKLEDLIPLAPLHQPHNLRAIRAVNVRAAGLPQVACFDTAFHRTQPDVAQRFGLPQRFAREGVRRYGFHGLSYEYIASVLPRFEPRTASGRTIVAHLGNGASLCGMLAGQSVATTMSFTPVDGLVMGTRVGSIDPGALLYLMTHHGMHAQELEKLLYHESGLLGVSGLSSDMRTLLGSDDPRAAEAVDLFVYRIRREIGSLVAALGGLDAIVFTGGIGENASSIRARICQDAAWLGVQLNADANDRGQRQINHSESRVTVWVIPTNEESMIAYHTRRLLDPSATALLPEVPL